MTKSMDKDTPVVGEVDVVYSLGDIVRLRRISAMLKSIQRGRGVGVIKIHNEDIDSLDKLISQLSDISEVDLVDHTAGKEG